MASAVVSDNFETSSGAVPELGGTGATTCKAWVNFNGTGTVAIRDSYNVSSITDSDVGEYTINYSNNMTDTNYSIFITNSYIGSSYAITTAMISGYSTSSITTYTQQEGAGTADMGTVNVAIFSN